MCILNKKLLSLCISIYLAVQTVAEYFKEQYKIKRKRNDHSALIYKSEKFIDLLFVLHKEPRTKRETLTKLKLHNAGNIDNPEIYFSKMSPTKKISEIFKPSEDSMSLKYVVLVEGAPGIGKTMVTEEIAYQWATSEEFLPNIKLLLLLYFRDPTMCTINSFEELMQHCYGEKDMASKCAKFIYETKGEGLMIIFDGYDEAPVEVQNNPFIMGLLNKILPKSWIVVTSRLHTISHLHQNCDCRVEIMGFTKEDRDNCLRDFLCQEKDDHEKNADSKKSMNMQENI